MLYLRHSDRVLLWLEPQPSDHTPFLCCVPQAAGALILKYELSVVIVSPDSSPMTFCYNGFLFNSHKQMNPNRKKAN